MGDGQNAWKGAGGTGFQLRTEEVTEMKGRADNVVSGFVLASYVDRSDFYFTVSRT